MKSKPFSDSVMKRSFSIDEKVPQVAEEDQPTASCTTDEASSYYSSKTSDLSLGVESLTFFTAVGYHIGIESDLPERDHRNDAKVPAEEILHDPPSQERREWEQEEAQIKRGEVTPSFFHLAEPDELMIPDGHRYRYIFKQYWKNQRGDACDTEVPHRICFPSLAPQTRDGPDFSEEKAKKAANHRVQEFVSKDNKKPTEGRRSIFGQNCYQQYSAVGAHGENPNTAMLPLPKNDVMRKGRSLRSSLRPCRYSGEFRRTASAENMTRNVSFSDLTEVSTYEKPVEQYADQSWANFFSWSTSAWADNKQ